jgi:phasin
MTQTAAKSARTASTAADAAMDAFSMGLQNVEIPAIFRDMADRTVTQAQDAYSRVKAAAEEATDMLDDAFETARKSAKSLSVKALEAAQANAEASFALFKDLLGAKTFADAIELQTAFARKQFDAASTQLKELQEATQKAFLDAAKPAREAAEKAFKTAAKAA